MTFDSRCLKKRAKKGHGARNHPSEKGRLDLPRDRQKSKMKSFSGHVHSCRSAFDSLTKPGIAEAVKILLSEPNTLFDDMVKKLNDFPELRKTLHHILFQGKQVPYNIDHYAINLGVMFGFMKLTDGFV